jgi:hypothetical protein
MHVLQIVTYPLKATVEVGKIFVGGLKDDPLPEYVKMLGLYVEYGGKGITTYDIYEIEKGHEDEGQKRLAKDHIKYYGVEGYEVISKTVMTAEEALPLIGLGM